MDIDLIRSAEQFHNRYRRNRIVRKLVSILACVVVFSTTYALILPAITMERETLCGLAEHQHTESCYTRKDVRHLACGSQSLGIHTHTAQCADGSCGYADFVIHEHNSSCYEDGKLVCPLPEVKAHTHTDDCYRIPTWEESGHTHTDECYTMTKGLSCGKTETEGHTHTDACRSQKQVLSCDTPESDGHHHGEGCYDENDSLTCTTPESSGHHHDAFCYRTEETMTCGKEESEPHQHTDACYAEEKTLICTEKEGPVVKQGAPELICGLSEIRAHLHTADCFDGAGSWICGQREVLTHTHTDACFETVAEDVLTCELEEHTHSEDCYPTEPTTAETEKATAGEATESDAGETHADVMAAMANVVLLDGDGGEPADTGPLPLPITSITGTGTTYNPETGFFDSNVTINFSIPPEQFSKDNTYEFTYPKGIVIPDALLNETLVLKDGRGTYEFVKTGDDYSVKVNITSIVSTEEPVTGNIYFQGTLDATKQQEHGNIVIGQGQTVLTIEAEDITYPANETNRYDISVEKQVASITDDQLSYTVRVSSQKGTPDPINFTDVIDPNGLTLDKPSVKVDGAAVTDLTWSDNKITMSLPGLGENGVYDITYTYHISEFTSTQMNPNNQVTVQAIDEMLKQTVTATDDAGTQIDKSHTLNKAGKLEGDKIKWTVTVNTNNTDITGARLEDTMLGNLSAGTNVTVKHADGSAADSSEYALSDEIITFLGDKNTNTYVITYYTDKPVGWETKEISNTARLDPDPNKPGDEKTETVTVGVGVGLVKNAVYNKDTGTITWTITINPNGQDLTGAVLTDAMLGSAKSIQILPDNGYTREGTGVTFTAVNEGPNTQSYTITYTTEANPAWSSQRVFNEAALEKDGNTVKDDAEVSVDSDGSVEKISGTLTPAEDGKTGVLPWTVTLKIPAGGLLADTLITDYLGYNRNHWNNGDVYMTVQQVKDAVGSFCSAMGMETSALDITVKDTRYGREYAYSDIDNHPNDTFRVLAIKLKNAWIPNPAEQTTVRYSYDTTVDLAAAGFGATDFYNYVEAGDKSDDAAYTYHKAGVVKTDGNGGAGTTTVTSSDGSVVWKVTATLDDQPHSKLDITDTLPAGVTLTTLSISGAANFNLTIESDGTISGSDGTYQVSGTYTSDPHKVVLRIARGDNGNLPFDGKFTIIYTCDVAENYRDGNAHSLKNDVTVAEIGSASQTQNWSYDVPTEQSNVISKTGGWNNTSRMLTYSVAINPDGANLIGDGSGTLTLIDTLSCKNWAWAWISTNNVYSGENVRVEVSLVRNSVGLYRAEKNADGSISKVGDKLSGIPWICSVTGNDDYSQNAVYTMEMTNVPDGQPLILEYMYNVTTGAKVDYTVDNLEISNTARLDGTEHSGASQDFSKKWENSQSSGEVTSGKTLTLNKVKRGDYSCPVPNAEFSVYKFNTGTNAYDEVVVKTEKTDTSGVFRIAWEVNDEGKAIYQYNTLYKVMETAAPVGYKMPETVPEFYFYFSSDTDKDHTLPQPLPSGAVDLSKTDHQRYVENEVDDTPRYELPETGGGGTEGYTLGGFVLTAGAALWLLCRRKRRREAV